MNKRTGRSRPIRYWEPEEDFTNATNEAVSTSSPSHRPILGPEVEGRAVGMNLDRIQVSVWLNGDWQPISANQTRRIREALKAGESRFEIRDGTFRFTID